MSKTILITGSTDGIGLETAKRLLTKGHHILLHGRNADKLNKIWLQLSEFGTVEKYIADLSDLRSVKELTSTIIQKHSSLDIIINNAGILKTKQTKTASGHDIRFMVNAIAPYLLTKALLPLLSSDGRVINLSSAAQATVDLNALKGSMDQIEDMNAYSQSKLAITMWSYAMACSLGAKGPMIIAVNPGSLLGSKKKTGSSHFHYPLNPVIY